MRDAKIQIEGKFHDFSEKKDYHIISAYPFDLLNDGIDDELIGDYAKNYLDMDYTENFESNLDDFDESDLIEHLEDSYYNFSSHIGEEECIEFLEDSGYIVVDKETGNNGLDIIDSNLLEEIVSIFTSAGIHERQEIYNLIKNK